MRRLYALRGDRSGQVLTYQGRVITHTCPYQLRWLCPEGARVVEINPGTPPDECCPIQFHPDFSDVRWGTNGTLTKGQFRDR